MPTRWRRSTAPRSSCGERTTRTSRWRWRERQREAFPSAEIAILEDSGHWPFADDPDGVGRHVEPFLSATLGARAAGGPA